MSEVFLRIIWVNKYIVPINFYVFDHFLRFVAVVLQHEHKIDNSIMCRSAECRGPAQNQSPEPWKRIRGSRCSA